MYVHMYIHKGIASVLAGASNVTFNDIDHLAVSDNPNQPNNPNNPNRPDNPDLGDFCIREHYPERHLIESTT